MLTNEEHFAKIALGEKMMNEQKTTVEATVSLLKKAEFLNITPNIELWNKELIKDQAMLDLITIRLQEAKDAHESAAEAYFESTLIENKYPHAENE